MDASLGAPKNATAGASADADALRRANLAASTLRGLAMRLPRRGRRASRSRFRTPLSRKIAQIVIRRRSLRRNRRVETSAGSGATTATSRADGLDAGATFNE